MSLINNNGPKFQQTFPQPTVNPKSDTQPASTAPAVPPTQNSNNPSTLASATTLPSGTEQLADLNKTAIQAAAPESLALAPIWYSGDAESWKKVLETGMFAEYAKISSESRKNSLLKRITALNTQITEVKKIDNQYPNPINKLRITLLNKEVKFTKMETLFIDDQIKAFKKIQTSLFTPVQAPYEIDAFTGDVTGPEGKVGNIYQLFKDNIPKK